MKLDRSVITISTTNENRGFFKLLDSIRPNYISFSQYLGMAANEYHSNHKEGVAKITDFTNKDTSVTPMYYSEIEMWRKYLDKMPKSEIKKFQKRHTQLGNIINKKIQGMIG